MALCRSIEKCICSTPNKNPSLECVNYTFFNDNIFLNFDFQLITDDRQYRSH